jgi:hypothetical protein
LTLWVQPGEYRAILTYNNGAKTVANWEVRKPKKRVAKNVLFFIGDGTHPSFTRTEEKHDSLL